MTLDELQPSDFLPYLHQMFHIRLEGVDPINLELVNITEQHEGASSARRPSFSLLFLGPVSNQYLLQSIYRLEHEQLGALDLFIVPLGPQQGRMRYEVIFG